MTGPMGKASKSMPVHIKNRLVVDYQIPIGETWLRGQGWIGRILNTGVSVGQYWLHVECDPKTWRALELESKYVSKSVPWTWGKIVERAGQV